MVEYTILASKPAPPSEGDHCTLHPINGRRKGTKGEGDGNNERGLGKHPVKGVR